MIATTAIVLFLANLLPITSDDGLSKDFFIDPYTGQSNCIIIVGENAAASDAMSAAWIAAQIGTMSYYEESTETYYYNELVYYANDGTYNKMNTDTGVGNDDAGIYIDQASIDTTAKAVLPFQDDDAPFWNYDIYVDSFTDFGEDSINWLVDTGFSYESITADLSVRDVNEYQETVILSNPATKQRSATLDDFDLEESQSYPSIYPRLYWGLEGDYDPLGGLEYRVIVYGMTGALDAQGTQGMIINEDFMLIDRNGLVEDLYRTGTEVYFIGESYSALEFGTDEDGYDYMLYGIPLWYQKEYNAGNTFLFENGWSINVKKIDIYNTSVELRLINPEGIASDYPIDMGDSITVKEEVLPGVSPTILSIEVDKITLKDSPTVSLTIYSLSEYGHIRETIYGYDEPYISSVDLEWHLDIVPADDVQELDVDNDVALYESGNPSYDLSDSLMVLSSEVEEGVSVPYLELWLATPIEVDDGNIFLGLLVDGDEYFHIDISDRYNGDLIIDDYIKVGRTTKETYLERNYVDIDNASLVIRDIEMTVDIKSNYNLILVGGPVVNSLVNELITLGVTTLDTWATSPGEYILYEDAFINGKDVIVVAGKDRESTNKAAKSLLDYLTNL
ncbi:MAG TPA: S-layer protein [Candidatus Methanofastidiosa archaeon]|nr:S-layer protein [Candidatus Methanofastidiosa archaeon]